VEVHHIDEQARGGEHSRRNCVTLCSTHHRMLHDGKLRIEGDGDAELRVYDAAGERMREPFAVTQGGSRVEEHEPLGSVEQRLLAIMGRRGGWHPDALCEASGLAIPQIYSALTQLEMAQRVEMSWGLYTPRTHLHP
jgi:predicted Rossmann fold nucleotide-binding protein DprA/Smf involved in DNA uptake